MTSFALKTKMPLVVTMLATSLLSLSAFFLLDCFHQPIRHVNDYALLALIVPACFSIAAVWALMRYLTGPLVKLAQEQDSLIQTIIPIPVFCKDAHLYKTTFESGKGGERGCVGTFIDISERKQAESALREAKELLENVGQNAAIPGFLLDANHKVLIWNRACEALTGVKSADVIGTTGHWRAFYDHERPCLVDLAIDDKFDDMSKYYTICGRSALNPDGMRSEGWCHLGGMDRYVIFEAVPIHNARGKLVAAIETIQDITELKLAEKELQQTLCILNATLESTVDGILVLDRKGKVINYNRQAPLMLDIPEAVLTGQSDMKTLELVLPMLKDPAVFLAKLKALYADQEADSYDVMEFLDGRIIECSSKPYRIDQKILGRVWSLRDVTSERKLEQQLRHAQKMKALGTLAGGIAHDFNNILTVVVGYGNLMKHDIDPASPLMHGLEQILTAADRATDLTKGLLAYSRKEAIATCPVDLNMIAKKVDKFVSRLIGEDIEMMTIMGDEELIIMADSGQIEQVIMNLAANARDAIAGEGSLIISTSRIELDDEFIKSHGYGAPGAYALLSVSDSGAGMDEATLDKIFEPFFTTKETGKGTGLGLSIVYGIVKQHKGYINVYSEHGRGTTFKIFLPLTRTTVKLQPTFPVSRPAGGTETLLLIEDSDVVRRLFRDILSRQGYTVIEAVDGDDGIAKYNEHRETIDLLIVDVIMPRKNGREVYDEIRRLKDDIKVIFTSGYTADIITRKGILEGGLNFVSKPISPGKLLSKVREVLDC
jgi:PAS domain S-box-containing protein